MYRLLARGYCAASVDSTHSDQSVRGVGLPVGESSVSVPSPVFEFVV